MGDVEVNKDNPKEVLDIISNASLSEFLKNEENCEGDDDVDSIFDEITRLASLSDDKFRVSDDNRTIEEILKEAEALINLPLGALMSNNKLAQKITLSQESTPHEIKNNILDQYDYSTTTTLHDVSTTLFELL